MRRLWLIALVACGSSSSGPPSGDGSDVHDDGGWMGNDAGAAGVVSCYTEGNPTATCTLPTHCCFDNFSAQHNGSCTSSSCPWGTISCDGPEDCPSAQRCCANAIEDAGSVVIGYSLACQASTCGASPAHEELCHPTSSGPAGTCSTGGTCVSAMGTRSDLPRTLYICR